MGIEFVRDEADKQFDALALKNAKPDKRYRFVRKKDIQMARAKFNGYEVVDRSVDNVESVLDDGTRMKKGSDLTTSVEVGDMILMSQPREKFEERMGRRQRKIDREAADHSKNAVAAMNAEGRGKVRAYEDNTESRGMNSVTEEEHLQETLAAERKKGRG